MATDFFTDQGLGLSVTMPFKLLAFELADTRSERALRAGAVNTLKFEASGSIYADNTDGVGLLTDITSNLGWPVAERRILILGAGGAVRGVLQSFLQAQPAELVIANRTKQKAVMLAQDFAEMGNVRGTGLADLTGSFDIVVNATGSSLNNEVPAISPTVIDSETLCYDMTYAANETSFNRWAKLHGAKNTSDGLGMLVEQAAVAFEIWHGVLPDTQPVITHIREEM